MATMKDIARQAETSITTVSRVLNYDKSLSISDDLRRKIFEVAQKLHYKTPRNRSKVTVKKKLRIGIIMWYDVQEEIDDPYYMQIRRGIEQLAMKSEIETVLLYRNQDEYRIQTLGKVDGLICVGKFSSAQIEQFNRLTNHLVFVDSSPEEELYDSIVIDFHSAVREVLQLLLQEGYNKIGYLGGVEYVSKHIRLGERRELVFRDFLYQRNKLHTKYIHVGSFSVESGYQLMKDALGKKDHADAYFCANDSIAFGAMRAIREAGLDIPGDIALVGFNDHPNSAYTFPPLTTVRVFTEFMGEQALLSMIEQTNGRHIALKKIIPTTLVKRDSI
ncbi:LacI family DNA-binding transcriptional regulator [Candidatus Xianfuyuplasma coldseepsis]|uniref:LacI family DNA-binding transcriptional regulator n=1 Tax=Candidatus Xianfuyuplasma coldseepsis TaxID=2782163 RepID=A0A7L7KP93_9MOLU|nr:LacI family DNA-binding transcriptional regulator [Xianfuyuplasma coldseepsis]QMS84355.1 LacI family DNA-binding transcriptional regulator [Xianfuyuplasma coldseepsis]